MTLTESLLVLAVGALVAVLAYGGYKMAIGNVKGQSSVDSAVRLLTSVKKTFGASGNYENITQALVKTSGIVPADFDTSSATLGQEIKAPWGGVVTITSATPFKTALITFSAVPKDICMDLAGGVEGMVDKLVVGAAEPGTAATIAKDILAATPVKYTPSIAAANCGTDTVAMTATLK